MLDLDLVTSSAHSILVTNTLKHNTAFLFHELLRSSLAMGLHILLVTVDNNTDHFVRLMKKASIVLPSLMDTSQLILLDLLSDPDASAELPFDFKKLFIQIQQQTKVWRSQGIPFAIFIESLSTLVSLNPHPEQTLSFCRYCLNAGNGRLITKLNSDVDGSLFHRLHTLFDFVIHPIPIQLISIANVDGRIRIHRNTLLPSESQETEIAFTADLYFRTSPSGVRFFSHVDLDL